MSAGVLLPDTVIHESGAGQALRTSDFSRPLLITLGILEVVEQQMLLVGIYGSGDGVTWGTEPLVQFPQKFYPGVSSVYLQPDVPFIRAQWKVDRWGRGSKACSFRTYIFAETIAG